MRIDIDTVPFVNAAAGAIFYLDLSGAESAAVGLYFTGFTGTPTTVLANLCPVDSMGGTDLLCNGDKFNTTTATAAASTGIMISRHNGGIIMGEGFLIPAPIKYARVAIGLNGGTSPTATGTIYIWKFVR